MAYQTEDNETFSSRQQAQDHANGLGYFDDGNKASSARDYDKAIYYYDLAIPLLSSRSSKAKAYGNRGNCYYNRSEYDKAIDDYTSAIGECGSSGNIGGYYLDRGDAYNKKGNKDQAIADWKEAADIGANEYFRTIGDKYLKPALENLAKNGVQYTPQKPQRQSTSSSSSSSSSSTPSSFRGSSGPGPGDRFLSKQKEAFASYNNNDIDNALKLCNDALEIYKPYLGTTRKDDWYAKFIAQTYNLRGVCYEAKGNRQQANDDYWEAINWGNEDAKKNFDNLNRKIGEEEEKKLKDKANNEYFPAADQLFNEGNYDKAIIQYTKVIRKGDNKAIALMKRAACYAKTGDKEQAIDDYTDAINSGLTGSDLATAKAELAKLK